MKFDLVRLVNSDNVCGVNGYDLNSKVFDLEWCEEPPGVMCRRKDGHGPSTLLPWHAVKRAEPALGAEPKATFHEDPIGAAQQMEAVIKRGPGRPPKKREETRGSGE